MFRGIRLSAESKKRRKKNRSGRRFILNFQIGYEAQRSNDEDDLSKPEEPTLKKAPLRTEPEKQAKKEEFVENSYGKIKSYEQWLEREREEQSRITNSRLGRGLIIAATVFFLGCGDDEKLTVLEPSDNVPSISVVNDGLLYDGRTKKRFGYHLQSDVVLEHDIIVNLRVTDIGEDNIVKQDDRLFMMYADTFRSKLLNISDSYVTKSEIRRRNQEDGENGWWGLGYEYRGRYTVDERGQVTQIFSPSQFHPPADLSLAGEKSLSWSQKHPSTTITILPAKSRTK